MTIDVRPRYKTSSYWWTITLIGNCGSYKFTDDFMATEIEQEIARLSSFLESSKIEHEVVRADAAKSDREDGSR